VSPNDPGAASGMLAHIRMVVDEEKGIRRRMGRPPFLPSRVAMSMEWHQALKEYLLWSGDPVVHVAGAEVPIIPVRGWPELDRPWRLVYG